MLQIRTKLYLQRRCKSRNGIFYRFKKVTCKRISIRKGWSWIHAALVLRPTRYFVLNRTSKECPCLLPIAEKTNRRILLLCCRIHDLIWTEELLKILKTWPFFRSVSLTTTKTLLSLRLYCCFCQISFLSHIPLFLQHFLYLPFTMGTARSAYDKVG